MRSVIVIIIAGMITGCVTPSTYQSMRVEPRQDITMQDYQKAAADCIEKAERSTSLWNWLLVGVVGVNRQRGKVYQTCMEGAGYKCVPEDCYY